MEPTRFVISTNTLTCSDSDVADDATEVVGETTVVVVARLVEMASTVVVVTGLVGWVASVEDNPPVPPSSVSLTHPDSTSNTHRTDDSRRITSRPDKILQ